MSAHTETPSYAAGDRVIFRGRRSTVTVASEPRATFDGRLVQTLTVTDDELIGMAVMIGSRHSELARL
jgi:hypothetical protein